MTGGKRLRIAALFVIVLVFAFIMDMSSNAITDNTLIRNDTGDGDAVYDLVLNADGLEEEYSYQPPAPPAPPPPPLSPGFPRQKPR